MSKRLKILAISYLFPNSNQPNHGIFVLNRLKAVSKYVDVKVINPIPWSPAHKYLDRYKVYGDVPLKEVIGGLEVYHPRFCSIPRYFKSIEGSTYLHCLKHLVEDLYQEFAFDIIDMHWTYPDLPAGLKLAEQYRKPTIVTLRGMEAFHQQDFGWRKHAVAKGLKRVDAVVALSQEMKEYGDKISGNPGKSVVIRNGVDVDNFYYMPKQDCRNRLQLPDNQEIIVSVGSLIYRKGFDLLISAMAELSHENICLYIIGSPGAEGDYSRALQDLARDKGVLEKVVFVGSVPNCELKYWYCAADVYCLASRGEGSPNVLSEALACGTPSVTTDVGSAREIIEAERDLGMCVPTEDSTILSAAISELLAQAPKRQKNAENFSRYSWDWCAQNTIPVYDGVHEFPVR